MLTIFLQEYYPCAATEFPQIPDLFKLGLYLEPAWKFLVCTQCEVALAALSAANHAKNVHRVPLKVPQIVDIFKRFDVVDELPIIDGPVPPISGLPLFPAALRCGVPKCPKMYCTDKSIKRHYREGHPDIPVPKSWRTGPAQRLDSAFHNSLFSVTLPRDAPVPPLSTWIGDLEATITAAIKVDPLKVSDPRELNPWLRATLWPTHVASYDVHLLQQLVALPAPTEFPWLRSTVTRKFLDDVKLIDQTPLLSLQKLNTEDPQKT